MKNEKTICLEVCVDSFASAMAAIRGGADRLELCTCLLVGGLTPDVALLRQIREVSDITVRCLMRPRFGDFLYTAEEIRLMERQIHSLKEAGASGFVIGCLTPEGELDREPMKRLIGAAGGLGLTLHRAIDVSRDAVRTAETAAELGIDTILTSGQAADCWTGRECLGRLLEARLPLTIMAGGGVNADVIGRLLSQYPLRAFHMSGKVTLDSGMRYRRPGVPMGLPGLDEFSVWQTDEGKIRQAVEVIGGHCHGK
ncbi:MAG: copper homeostasis protein CutC [Faecousia sp.]